MAWRNVFVKERANVWQQGHGVQTSGAPNRLWHCLGRSVKEGNEVIPESVQMGEILGNSLQDKEDTVPLAPPFLYVNAMMQYAKINVC